MGMSLVKKIHFFGIEKAVELLVFVGLANVMLKENVEFLQKLKFTQQKVSTRTLKKSNENYR
jgi:hypothetical protein